MRRLRLVSRLVAVSFLVPLGVHVLALASPRPEDPSTGARHAVFVGVNAFFAAAFWRGSRHLLVPTLVLVGQQALSHGRDLARSLEKGSVDVPSALVLLFLPLLLGLAVALRRTSPSSDAP